MLLRWLISVANAPTGSPYTPGPELGALTQLEIRRTALARAREMIDYRTFRDMMAESAPDHEPSSKTTRIFFATMQNKLYLHVVGTTAEDQAGPKHGHLAGIEEGKSEPSAKNAARKVAKNNLTEPELRKLDRLVGRLCLRAEDIADDDLSLSRAQGATSSSWNWPWRNLQPAA
ncbi:RhuM family protein [Streptomyces sp. NRRL F-5140]